MQAATFITSLNDENTYDKCNRLNNLCKKGKRVWEMFWISIMFKCCD